ncbi:MAG TPA: dihydropteroate synthase [Alphaproteobacteria bacterium]|nr:dihydropteroate synthase [Alphaproteobacteria bacterium]
MTLFSDSTSLMGIVNVTPDSFSDGGSYLDPARGIEQGLRLVEEGAEILDVGGESTRPGAPPVDPREEIRRIAPVLKGLAGRVRYLSVDTRHAQTMRLALDLGANFINDISALSFDPQALDVAASAQGPVCLMHMRGTPETMSQYTIYNNIIEDVLEYFVERIAVCERAGIERRRLVLDPGLGFAKTTAQNLTLIREIGRVCALGFPVLMGASRKRFISEADRDCAPDQRLGGSLASALYAAAQGVKILRVHDVAATRQALAVQQALQLNSPPTRR